MKNKKKKRKINKGPFPNENLGVINNIFVF